jgi:hypothetical protein
VACGTYRVYYAQRGGGAASYSPQHDRFFVHRTLADLVKAGQTLLPDLKRLVLVGDPLDGLVYYPQFAKNSPTSQKSLKSLISWVCR